MTNLLLSILSVVTTAFLITYFPFSNFLKIIKRDFLSASLISCLFFGSIYLGGARPETGTYALLDPLRLARVALFAVITGLAFLNVMGLLRTGSQPTWKSIPVSLFMMLLYGGFAMLTAEYSPSPEVSLWKGFEVVTHVAVACSVALSVKTIDDARNMMEFTIGWVTFLCISFLLGVLLFPDRAGGIQGLVDSGIATRYYGVFPVLNADDAGQVCGIVSLIGMTYLALLRLARGRIILYGLIGLALIGSLLAHSRTELLCIVIGMVVLAIYTGNKIATYALLLIGALFISSELISQITQEYILRGQSYSEFRSLTGRAWIWQKTLEEVSQNPFFGNGFYTTRITLSVTHAHNAFLMALHGGGLMLLIPLLAATAVIVRNIYVSRPQVKRPLDINQGLLWCEVTIVFLFVFIRGLTGTGFEGHHYNLTLFCLSAIAANILYKTRKMSLTAYGEDIAQKSRA